MRAQAKVRKRYVVIRLTHQQLLAVHKALGFAMPCTAKQGYEIIGHAARAIHRGERGDLSRAGMLYEGRGAYVDAQRAVEARGVGK